MHQYTAREAMAADLPNFIEWMHANRGKNKYDPTIFGYESTRVLVVDKDGEPECFLPYQLTIMTESLAPRPARTKRETALALKTAIHSIARIAKQSKIGEIFFLSDPEDRRRRHSPSSTGTKS